MTIWKTKATGRSHCVKCGKLIPKGKIVFVFGEFRYGHSSRRYQHIKCVKMEKEE